MENWLKEQELRGNGISLLPLRESHRDGLLLAASDGELWDLWYTGVPGESTIDQYIETALNLQHLGSALPFVVVENATSKIMGCTRYCRAEAAHRRVEVGYTWYAKSVQKTSVNTQCKLLLLQHAFDELKAIAVEFRTHWHNHASRSAIARLGAKQDGVLRNHSIEPDGAYRDTVVFSILESEWPSVKKSLKYKLEKMAKLES